MKSRSVVVVILCVFSLVAIIGGITYARFVYEKDLADIAVTTGQISINIQNVVNNASLSNAVPTIDNTGKASSNYLDFEITGTVDSEPIYYELYMVPKSGSNLDTNYLKIYLTDQTNQQIKDVTIYNELMNSTKPGGKIIYRDVIEINNDFSAKTVTEDFRLRLWIDESYAELSAKSFNFDIYLYAFNVPRDFELPSVSSFLRNNISDKINAETNSCNPVWVDDMGTANDETDDVTYFSGSSDCVDMNYVWYSGKMWRIIAMYPDGSVKMVTEKPVSHIQMSTGTNPFYTSSSDTSIMYKWLNEDFLDTLYNYQSIIDSTKEWNQTATAFNSSYTGSNYYGAYSARPANTSLFSANVGLLNSYEYYAIGVNDEDIDDLPYLNKLYYAILLNKSSSDDYFYHDDAYEGGVDYSAVLRPAIYVKGSVEIKSGSGTVTNPFIFEGDKNTGNINDKINTRVSGEYIKFANTNDLFRIIDIEDSTTKIVRNELLNPNITLELDTAGSSVNFYGEGTAAGTGTWYTYLNNTWYNELYTSNGDLFTTGKYYRSNFFNTDYRLSICTTANSPTKTCTKLAYDSHLVGILRHGEMFAVDEVGEDFNYVYQGLITKWGTADFMGFYGGDLISIDDYMEGGNTGDIIVKPTLNLKSTVKILSGSGTSNDPYVVGL